MIELSRKQVHIVRSTLRHALGRTSTRRTHVVTFQAGPEALLIRAANDNLAIELRIPGSYPASCWAIPVEALAACEGRQQDVVQFKQTEDQVTVEWIDSNVPQSAQHRVSESIAMPDTPCDLAPVEREFLDAMADAAATTDNTSTRYALNCVRLRGADGQIAATDGQQALIQTGYQFPWTEEVLVPASGIFAAKSIREMQNVSIGRSAEWMVVRAGNWTIAFKLEKDRRFPALDSQVPNGSAAATTMVLAEDDAEFLARATSRMPGADEANGPVTLDLNGAVVVRSKSAEQQVPTDLMLRNSQRRGAELKVCSNRDFIKRAIRLGFREIHFRDDEAPAFCRDARRVYVWALLGKNNVLRPDTSATRIESPVVSKTSNRTPSKLQPILTASSNTGHLARNRISPSQFKQTHGSTTETGRTDANTMTALIEDGQALRVALRDVLTKTNRLVAGLKRQRQQSKAMRTALKSLRAVQSIEV